MHAVLPAVLHPVAQTLQAILAAVPDPGAGTAPPGVSAGFTTVLSWAKWIVSGLGVLGLFAVGGAMFLTHRRGQGGEHGAALGWVMAGCLVVAAAPQIAGALIT